MVLQSRNEIVAEKSGMSPDELPSFANLIEEQKKQSGLAFENAIRQILAQPTFGLSSILMSPFTSDEKKAELLKYKSEHPIESALWGGVGLLGGGIATGALKSLIELPEAAGAAGVVLRAANAESTGLKALKTYELLQGTAETTGFLDAMKVAGIGTAMMSGINMVDDATLDPVFVGEHFSTYAGEILKSGIAGVGLGLGFKALGQTYNKFVNGEDFFAKAKLPTTFGEQEYLGTKLAKARTPYIGMDGTFNEGLIQQDRAVHFNANIGFLDNLERSLIATAESISRDKNLKPTPDDISKALFIAEMHGSEDVAYGMATGQIHAEQTYNDWLRTVDMQKQYNAFGSKPTIVARNIKGSLMNSLKNNASIDLDSALGRARGVLERTLNEDAERYFSSRINDISNNPDFAYLLSENGALVKPLQMFKDIRDGKLDPRFAKSQIYRDAVKEIAKLANDEPKLFNEITAQYKKFAGKLVQQDRQGRYFFRRNLTGREVYDAMQAFRTEFNDRVADIQTKLKERFVIGNPAVDNLWNDIKGVLFENMRKVFGDFGETAAMKSEVINEIGRQERLMLANLTKGEIRKLPGFATQQDRIMRKSMINDAWGRLENAGERATPEYQTGNVTGWIESTRDNIVGSLDRISERLPSAELSGITREISEIFERQLQHVDDLRVMNDTNIMDLFKSAEKFVERGLEKGYHGVGIPTRFAYAAKDFLEATAVPQVARYGFAQIMRIAMDSGTILGKRFLKRRQVQYDTVKDILYNSLMNVSKLSAQKTRFVRAIGSAVSGVLNLKRIDEIGHAMRNELGSYAFRAETAQKIDEINEKYDKISKNVKIFRENSEPYVLRIQAVLGNLSMFSEKLATEASQKTIEQMAMVGKILPEDETPDGYTKSISVSQKAEFLDNFEALTDPMTMLRKIEYGTITNSQLKIFSQSYPDTWEKLMAEVKKQVFLSNPPFEVKSRAYSMFGLQDDESQYHAIQIAQMQLQAQLNPPKPAKLPTMRASPMKSVTTPMQRLTPQGIQNR